MHHHNHMELHRQRAVELHRRAALSHVAHGARRNRRRVRATSVCGVVARGVWALRGVPNLIS